MKVVQNGPTITDTLSICLSDVHVTSGMVPSPSGCTADNYPEPVFHPRMNSRSEANTLYCVRTPLTLHMSCHVSVCYVCFVFTVFIPPYSPVDPATTAADAAGYDYYVDDQAPTTELAGK